MQQTKLNRGQYKLKKEIEEMLGFDYSNKDELYNAYAMIEDLKGYVEQLIDEIKEIEEDRDENYKPIIRQYED